MRSGRWPRPAVAVAVLGALALAIFLTFPRWTVDDAYISFRYARNLAEHGRLAWNLTGNPVEGYTGVLLPLLIAGFLRIGVPATVASQLVGSLAFAGATLLLARIVRRAGAPTAVTLGVCAVFQLAPYLFTHAFAGLETMLFSFLLLLATDRAIGDGDGGRHWLWLACSCTALSSARPEGIFFSGLLLLGSAFAHRRALAASLRGPAVAVALGYLLPFGAYFAWRWRYYGRLFPNTYYVKAASGFFPVHVASAARWWTIYLAVPVAVLAHVLPRVAAREPDRRPLLLAADVAGVACAVALSLMRAQQGTSIVLVAVALAAAIAAVVMRARDLSGRVAWPVGLVAAGSIAVVTAYLATDLLMNYSYRFFAPFFAVALIAAALAARNVRWNPRALLAPAAMAVTVALYAGQLNTERTLTSRYERAQRDEHVAIGRDLKRVLPPGSHIGVHFDAGAIPYYAGSQHTAVDFGRLNDEFLTDGGDGAGYFYRSELHAFVVTSLDRTELKPLAYETEVRAIIADPRFARYRLWRRYTTADQPYSEFVYLRDDVTAT